MRRVEPFRSSPDSSPPALGRAARTDASVARPAISTGVVERMARADERAFEGGEGFDRELGGALAVDGCGFSRDAIAVSHDSKVSAVASRSGSLMPT